MSTAVEPAEVDPVAVAFRGLRFGIVLGVGLQSLAMFLVRTVQAGAPPPTGSESPPLSSLLIVVLGTVAGLLGTAAATWRVLTPIRDTWRQGMLSIVGAFASFALAVVILRPIDGAWGRAGLAGLAAVALALSAWIRRTIPRMSPAG